jgi:hypothetical protein
LVMVGVSYDSRGTAFQEDLGRLSCINGNKCD